MRKIKYIIPFIIIISVLFFPYLSLDDLCIDGSLQSIANANYIKLDVFSVIAVGTVIFGVILAFKIKHLIKTIIYLALLLGINFYFWYDTSILWLHK